MGDLVRCRFCGRTYDLGRVEVVARYVDCSVWLTPCCGNQADDRGDTGWKPVGDYTHLGRQEHREVAPGVYITQDGSLVKW